MTGFAGRLESPRLRMDFAKLPAHWRRTIITVRCERPRGLEEGPWLTGALRGAWGHGLRRVAQEATATAADDAFSRPSALSAFFATHAKVTGRLAVPKPFVLAVDDAGRELEIRLTLFGMAGYWRLEAYRALLYALDFGIRLTERGRFRVPFTTIAADWCRTETLAVPVPLDGITVRVRTPLRLRASGPLNSDLADFIFSLVDRLSGLARWQGIAIDTDWGGWRRTAQRLEFEQVALTPYAWQRRSSLQKRSIPMAGLMGRFNIANPPPALMPLLALGATAHAGAHATFGLGRYDLLYW